MASTVKSNRNEEQTIIGDDSNRATTPCHQVKKRDLKSSITCIRMIHRLVTRTGTTIYFHVMNTRIMRWQQQLKSQIYCFRKSPATPFVASALFVALTPGHRSGSGCGNCESNQQILNNKKIANIQKHKHGRCHRRRHRRQCHVSIASNGGIQANLL